MKKSVKTIATSLLAGMIAFGAVSAANAMSPKAQEAFGKAQISAAQAVSAAQAKIGADAKVRGVDFEHETFGKDHFEVKLFANGQKHKVSVDAATGEILGTESKTPKKVVVSPNEEAAPKVSFEQAMNTAVAKTGGKVAEADLERRGGQAFYKIETVNNGQEFVVAVDADNGQIIDMPKKDKKHDRKHEHKKGDRHEKGERAQQGSSTQN